MANRLNLHLDDWRDELQAEPPSLVADSAPAVDSAANQAAAAVAAAYPVKETGNLRAGVRVVEPEPGAVGPGVATAIVVSGAPHAHLYEDGTHVARPHPTFYPITESYGYVMERDVTQVVRRHGFGVTGAID